MAKKMFIRLFLVVLMLASALTTWLLIRSDVSPEKNSAELATPEIAVLTDKQAVKVNLQVSFTSGSITTPGLTQYGAPLGNLPLGSRIIDLSFRVPVGTSTLRYILLSNRDGAVTSATSSEGVGYALETRPGRDLDSNCSSIQNLHAAQVISGFLTPDTTGFAKVSLVGGVPTSVSYPEVNNRIAVNVIGIVPRLSEYGGSGAGEDCYADLIDWNQVGGQRWYGPRALTGQVSVGDVASEYFVESANPPTTDPRRLEWIIDGPTSISYTLFDGKKQGGHELRFLFAGVAAGLVAALLIELIKSSWESSADESAGIGVGTGPQIAPDRHPAKGFTVLVLVLLGVSVFSRKAAGKLRLGTKPGDE